VNIGAQNKIIFCVENMWNISPSSFLWKENNWAKLNGEMFHILKILISNFILHPNEVLCQSLLIRKHASIKIKLAAQNLFVLQYFYKYSI